MAFHDVDYEAYCILGDPDAPALWNWPVWNDSGGGVRPVNQGGTRQPRSLFQLHTFRIGVAPSNSDGSVGRRRTTRSGPMDRRRTRMSRSRGASGVGGWGTVWTACEREGRPPDVFLSVANESELVAARGFHSTQSWCLPWRRKSRARGLARFSRVIKPRAAGIPEADRPQAASVGHPVRCVRLYEFDPGPSRQLALSSRAPPPRGRCGISSAGRGVGTCLSE